MDRKGIEVLDFEAFAKVNTSVAYAASYEFNAVFKVNLNTENCSYIGMFPDEKINGKRLYTKALYINGKVYFVPASAKRIAVLDVYSEEMDMLDIEEVDVKKYPFYKSNAKFNGGIVYQNWIYMIACTYPGIIRIDSETNQIVYFHDWVGDGRFVFRKSPVIDQHEFYIPSVINNKVLKFDMDTNIGKLYSVGVHNTGCWSMCKYGEEFWIAPKNPGAVICWNPNTDKINEYKNYPEGFQDNGFAFTKIYVSQNELYLIPAYANMGIKISPKDGCMSNSGIFEQKENLIVKFMIETENAYYLKILDGEDEKYFYLNMETNQIRTYLFKFSEGLENYKYEYYKKIAGNTNILKEKKSFQLNDFLQAVEIFSLDKSVQAVCDKKKTIGEQIFRKVISDL